MASVVLKTKAKHPREAWREDDRPLVKGDEFESDWEVNEIKVEIVETEVVKGPLKRRPNMFFCVVRIPQFANPNQYNIREGLVI